MAIRDTTSAGSRRRWMLPIVAAVAALAVITGIAGWPHLSADAVTATHAGQRQAAVVAAPAAIRPETLTFASTPAPSTPSRTCQVPPALTVAQIKTLAKQPVLPPAALPAASPAREPLRAMIRTLAPAGCDTRRGRYAHSQTRQWATNMSSSGGVTTLDVQVWQYQRWRAENNSGRLLTITAPTEGSARTDQTCQPGEIDEPLIRLPTDPGILDEQFNRIQPAKMGPQSVLRAWSDLNAWFSPDRAQRAAALTVFRDSDNIAWHGSTHDRAGRPGIALSVTSDNGGTRDLLILDPRTGELLAYELTALRDPGALGITEPTVLDYQLFLAHTHTATTRQP